MSNDLKIKTTVVEPTLTLESFFPAGMPVTAEELLSADIFNKTFRQGGLITPTKTGVKFIHFSRIESVLIGESEVKVLADSKFNVITFASVWMVPYAAEMLKTALERFYRYPEPKVISESLVSAMPNNHDYASTEA